MSLRAAERAGHRSTTRHAQAVYPFMAAGGLGGRGVFIGRDAGGGAFCYDPWVLYGEGALDDPNAIVLGKLGQGKSALVKTLLWRMLLFGRRAFVLDVKREYGPLCRAVGVRPISLVPGGGVRLNPLASRPEEHAQLDLLRAVAVTATGGPLTQIEAAALREALRTVRARGTGEPTLPDIAAVLFSPSAEMAARLRTSVEQLATDARRAALALQDLCEGPLRGMFDGPTTPGLDLDAHLLVLDLHAVRDSPAVGILMACASAWMSALLARMAERPGRGRLINVADESWKIVQHTGLGEWFQSNFKLARQFGVMNLVVLHKLADLQAAGDAGSRAARIAEGLIADASTLIVYHQDESQVPLTRQLLGLSETEARLISMLSAGQALWRVGSRSFVVQHYRSRHESELTNTDTGMRITDDKTSRAWNEGISDVAMLAVIAGVLAAAGLVWLWGGIAGALFGGGWPSVGVGQLLDVLARLPAHLSDPAGAWPVVARAELPRPGGFYAALAVLGLTGAALVVPLARTDAVSRLVRGGAGARWAGGGELRVLRGRGAGRLTLGRHRGGLLHAEHRHALVAFGPPQSGKSSGLAIPALLEWEGPAVASSIKTDLLGATLRRRDALGHAFIFDPFALAGVPSHTWSPLSQAATWDGALEVAWRLTAAGEVDQRGVEGEDFWAIAAEQRLAPLLFTASATGATIESVVRWAYGQGARELHDSLDRLAACARDERRLEDAHAAYDAVRAFEAQADRTRSSIEATAQALLRAYRFGRVARSARGSEITADRLLDEAATLYLIGDAKASKLLRPIFLALLSEIVDRAYERATLAGGRLDRPLLLCLDEAGNVAPLPNLAEIASTAPSHNIQLVSIFHDLAQARTRYGRQAETVVNSHRARMLLPGVADLETLRYFAGLIGEEETRDQTRTTGSGGTTRSTALRRRPLVAAEALRQIRDGHALLLYGRIPLTEVRLRMWFADRSLRRLARR